MMIAGALEATLEFAISKAGMKLLVMFTRIALEVFTLRLSNVETAAPPEVCEPKRDRDPTLPLPLPMPRPMVLNLWSNEMTCVGSASVVIWGL